MAGTGQPSSERTVARIVGVVYQCRVRYALLDLADVSHIPPLHVSEREKVFLTLGLAWCWLASLCVLHDVCASVFFFASTRISGILFFQSV